MKENVNLKLILILFLSLCYFTNLQAGKKVVDSRLVGSWWGSEKDEQMKGVLVKWVQQRNSDGTLITNFTYIYDDGMEDTSIEKGKWWVKDGKFFEQSTESKKPDIYTYEVVDENHIIFTALKLSEEFENINYKFVDTRVEKDSVSNSSR